MVTAVSCDQQKLHETSRNIYKKMCLIAAHSPFTKITYILSLPCVSETVSQSCLRCCCSLPQLKLHSQLSHCISVFQLTGIQKFTQLNGLFRRAQSSQRCLFKFFFADLSLAFTIHLRIFILSTINSDINDYSQC